MTDVLRFVFIGAHHDDVEIAAGGTIAKFVALGHDVSIVVLTDEKDEAVAKQRRGESRRAAACLGVAEDRVLFLNFSDGYVQALPECVGALRRLLDEKKIDPDVIVTHSANESHQDHRNANELVLTTFRNKVILTFAVVNHLVPNSFKPGFFVDITNSLSKKRCALEAHESQNAKGRIQWQPTTELDMKYGRHTAGSHAEAYEITVQHGSEHTVHSLLKMNDSAFHLLWSLLLGNSEGALIHGVPVHRRKQQYQWTTDKDREGIQRLSEAFRKAWFDKTPFWESSALNPGVEHVLDSHPVILSGGPVSNPLTRDYLMRIPSLRYIIEYDMPDWQNIRLFDRVRRAPVKAHYGRRGLTNDVEIDYGLLTIMRNPSIPSHNLIGCMGIHGFGSLACFEYLSDGPKCAELLSLCKLPLTGSVVGYQVLIKVDVRNERYQLLSKRMHVMKSDGAGVVVN